MAIKQRRKSETVKRLFPVLVSLWCNDFSSEKYTSSTKPRSKRKKKKKKYIWYSYTIMGFNTLAEGCMELGGPTAYFFIYYYYFAYKVDSGGLK